MKSLSSSRRPSPTRISLNVMLFLLIIACAPCAVSPLALAAESEPMVSFPGGVAPQASGLLAAATPAPADMRLRLRIYLNLRNKEAARTMSDDLHNASSPNYRKWLTPQKFDELFGPVPASYDAIAAWLRSQGFSVTATRPDRRDVEFTGTVAQADHAFRVQIKRMRDGNNWGILSGPMIPARFQGVIQSVMGLDNLNAVSPASTVSTPTGSVTAFAPADFYTFYDENALLNAGVNGSISGMPTECLAILGLSDYLPAAVTAFDAQFSLTAPSITKRFADGSNPGPTHDVNELEAELDLEWGHAVAPGAPLTFYLGDTSVDAGVGALIDAFTLATSDNTCGTISISFATCGLSGSQLDTWDSIAMQANTHGQSVFVASGDHGGHGLYYNPNTQPPSCQTNPVPPQALEPNVNEISADPYVTSVGGTQFYPNYAGLNGVPLYGPTGTNVGFVPEEVWSTPWGASGGGFSRYFTKPNYQVLSTPSDGQRDVPDVALMAGAVDANGVPNPGAFLGDDPSISGSSCPGPGACVSCCFGGTSLATVLWAGVSKLIQQQLGGRLGNINPELYSLAQLESTTGLRDVTATPTPSYYGTWPALIGYDQATGWGTPDITTFVNLFASNQVVLLGGATPTKNITTGEAYNPVTQQFSSLGAVMTSGRVNYGVAKLPDGTILLAGGNKGSTILKTADIFNPVTNTYSATNNNMAKAYFDFAQAVTLETGQVFIIGTTTSGNLSLWTEIYDPPSQSFSTPVRIFTPSGSSEPQFGYTTTLLGNGQVLIQGAGSTAQLYDPIAKTFTETAGQPPLAPIPGGAAALYSTTAVLLPNGMVLGAGGQAATIYASSFAYLYNPATKTFAATGSMNKARCDPESYALPNGEAMVMGSVAENEAYASTCYIDNTVEIYNPGTGTFTLAQMTTDRDNPFVSVIPNPHGNLTAQVLMAGGFTSTSVLDNAEIYDPVFGTFTALPPTAIMTTPSAGGAGFPFALPAR